MSKVEDIFEYDLVNNVDMECKKETKQIFMYLKQINELQYMNEEQIKNEIQINKWEPEVIPKNMLTRPAVSYIVSCTKTRLIKIKMVFF